MILTEKDIIEKVKFLIADQEAGARVPSFLAGWHDENAIALTATLDAYIRLNKLEKLSREMTGKSLKDLVAENGREEVGEKKLFRAKYASRVDRKRGSKV